MGSRKKKQKDKQKLREHIDTGTEENRFPRREFLRKVVNGAALAAVSSLFNGSETKSEWLFETPRPWPYLKGMPAVDVIERYVPVNEPDILEKDTPRFNKIVEETDTQIRQLILSRGYPPGMMVKPSEQFFVVPERPEVAASALKYFEKAVDFMYEKLPKLRKIDVDWRIVRDGENHTQNTYGRAFIGHAYFIIERVDIYDPKTDVKLENLLARSVSMIGARAMTDWNHDDGNEWYAIMSTEHPAVVLSAPFSELIPVAVSETTGRYRKDDKQGARILDEALSEALSYNLAQELAAQLGIRNAKHHLDEGFENIEKKLPEYVLVKNAARFIQRHGMQAALDLYLENMEKFKEEILKV